MQILVVAPAWVGDMVMSQVIHKALKRVSPECEIDVLAPAGTLPLAGRMPEVREAVLIRRKHGQLGLGYRQRLGLDLRCRGYDRCIVTPNSFKSALVPYFADIPVRTGFLGEYRYLLLNDLRTLDVKRLPRLVDRFLSLAGKSGAPQVEEQWPSLVTCPANAARFLESHGLETDRKVLGLCPGAAFGDAKRWPEANFAAIAKAALLAGWAVRILGGPADRQVGARIAALAGDGCVNLAGSTTLTEVVDLLAVCDEVVTNDSGLMHVAAAAGVKVTAVYGSTSPDFTPPLSRSARIVRTGIGCSPCFKRVCPLQHKKCLVDLPPADVLVQLSLEP